MGGEFKSNVGKIKFQSFSPKELSNVIDIISSRCLHCETSESQARTEIFKEMCLWLLENGFDPTGKILFTDVCGNAKSANWLTTLCDLAKKSCDENFADNLLFLHNQHLTKVSKIDSKIYFEAMYNIAVMYVNGCGVPRDIPKGFAIFEQLRTSASFGNQEVSLQNKINFYFAKCCTQLSERQDEGLALMRNSAGSGYSFAIKFMKKLETKQAPKPATQAELLSKFGLTDSTSSGNGGGESKVDRVIGNASGQNVSKPPQ